MELERTLVIVKPDGVQRGLVGPILGRLEARGLKLVGLKMLTVPESLARQHYAVHEGRPFFDGLIQYICASPVVVAVFEGTGAISVVRTTVGVTNPAQSAPGTIRGDWALEIGRNLIHASDGAETAAAEVALWFESGELAGWNRSNDPWIYE